jgi:hypothetical protein
MIFASRYSTIICFLIGVTYEMYIFAFILPSRCYTSNPLNLYYGGARPESATRQRMILNHFHGFLSLLISV